MDQNPSEGSGAPLGEIRTIESGLKLLWERTRRAAELIAELRSERRELQAQVGKLDEEVRRLRDELARKEHLVRKLSAEAVDSSARAALVTDGEREDLLAKVRDLLGKLESHL